MLRAGEDKHDLDACQRRVDERCEAERGTPEARRNRADRQVVVPLEAAAVSQGKFGQGEEQESQAGVVALDTIKIERAFVLAEVEFSAVRFQESGAVGGNAHAQCQVSRGPTVAKDLKLLQVVQHEAGGFVQPFFAAKRLDPLSFSGHVVGVVEVLANIIHETEGQGGGGRTFAALHLDVDVRLGRMAGVAAHAEHGSPLDLVARPSHESIAA